MRRKVSSMAMWLIVVLALTAAWAWASEPPARNPDPRILTAAELELCAAARQGAGADVLRVIENAGDVRNALRVPIAADDRYALIDACAAIGL